MDHKINAEKANRITFTDVLDDMRKIILKSRAKLALASMAFLAFALIVVIFYALDSQSNLKFVLYGIAAVIAVFMLIAILPAKVKFYDCELEIVSVKKATSGNSFMWYGTAFIPEINDTLDTYFFTPNYVSDINNETAPVKEGDKVKLIKLGKAIYYAPISYLDGTGL